MPLLLTDDDIRDALTPALALPAVREVIAGAARGEVVAPARIDADLTDGVMTFTVGATPEVYGYRSYDSLGPGKVDQIVTCLDRRTRKVLYVHAGSLVGIARTGAIGGVAIDAMADPGATSLTLIGSGIQAYYQAWAINAVRRLSEVRVYSPRPQRRESLAERLRTRLDLPARALSDPREAVDGAQIVVLATNATQPVIDTSWLADGAHVSSLGPKGSGAAEYDDRLPAESFAVTDSMPQLASMAGSADGVEHLGAHLEQSADRLQGKRFTMFQSCGLAGTEVALLHALGRALAP